jgi:transcriptional regulator with XRE-family HTH domain
MGKEKAPDPRTAFGLRLRQLRLDRGLSQEALAEAAGLDRTYVSSCERGRRNVSLLNIHKLAAALGAAPEELLRRAARHGAKEGRGDA